jgi:hypothetical protein
MKNDCLEKQLNEFREIISNVAQERSTTNIYDFLRFMPISNMFIDILGRLVESCSNLCHYCRCVSLLFDF